MTRGGSALAWMPPRPESGRIVGGVCAGIAQRYDLDPTLIRLAFLLLVFARGLGIVAYALLWAFMPAERSRAATLVQAAAENVRAWRDELGSIGAGLREAWARAGEAEWPRPLGRRWLAILLIALGGVILLWSFGAFSWLTGPRILGLLAVTLGAAALLSLTREDGRR